MPSETIVAVFGSATAAERAIDGLLEDGIPRSAIDQFARDPGIASDDYAEDRTGSSRGSFWSWLSGGGAHERHAAEYDRSIEGGHSVVTVVADATEAHRVIDILERHSPINLEEHDAESAGRTEPYGSGAAGGSFAATSPLSRPATTTGPITTTGPMAGTSGVGTTGMGPTDVGATDAGRTGAGPAGLGATGRSATASGLTGVGPRGDEPLEVGADPLAEPTFGSAGAAADRDVAATAPLSATESAGRVGSAEREEVVPLSEETLDIGKREVDRGVTRVRRYVVERPVDEQIRLRDERVSVFRRPVTGRTGASDAFSEKVVEMTETDEEAVVAKKVVVGEEVVIRKDVEERVENVHETLRKEEVEITGPDGKRTETDRL